MKSNLDNRTLLEQSPIRTLFFKYALPSVVTVLFFGFQNLVDGIVVGKALGEIDGKYLRFFYKIITSNS